MPANFIGWLSLVGAFCFGIVVGWVTYRTLRRSPTTGLSDIATVIGAIGGATVAALFNQGTGAFGTYCIGLLIGFFGYLIVAAQKDAPDWMGTEPGSSNTGGGAVIRPPKS
jgi:NhaP-type Na+/H+ or K+/H+ antiporter